MLSKDEFTLICPENDLEGVTIIAIARQYGIDTRISKQGWGGKLGEEPAKNLQNLKKKVVIVELFDLKAEEKLRNDGYEVIIIDHHNYAGVTRWTAKSSLEQFCDLIGHQMDERLWRIAINDATFIFGLFRMCLSYEDLEKLRFEEREILGTSDIFGEALEFFRSGLNRKKFSDLDVLLVPSRFQQVMGEAAQWPSKTDYENAQQNGTLELKNCLLIYRDEVNEKQIVQIEFYGDGRYSDTFKELVNDTELNYFFEMWHGGSTSNCYWGAKPRGEFPSQVDKLLDRVLSFVLIQGRPLCQFATTLLFPFRFESGISPPVAFPEDTQQSYDPEEIIYFLPHIRKLFYNQDNQNQDSIKRWTLFLKEPSAHIDVFISKTKMITMPLSRLNLYRFFNGMFILEISVLKRTNPKEWKDIPFWQFVFRSEVAGAVTVEDALIFNNLSRILYSSYPEQKDESNIPERIEWYRPADGKVVCFEPKFRKVQASSKESFSCVVAEMIGAFFQEDNRVEIDLDAVWDDRMFVHSCFALAGDKPSGELAEERYQAMFAAGVYVDQIKSSIKGQNDYAYDEKFTKALMKPLTYTRWYGPYGSLYGFSHFSAIFMGFGSFFLDKVTKHVDSIYLRQSIMALFYRSSLLFCDHSIVQLEYPSSLKEDIQVNRCLQNIRKIHWDLTLFSNRYWHSELTSQDQGIELFECQTKAMDLENKYDHSKQKIERIYEVFDSTLQAKLNRIAGLAGIFGFLFAIITIASSFTGLRIMMESSMDRGNSVLYVIVVVLTILGTVIFAGVALYLIRKLMPFTGIYPRGKTKKSK